MVNSGKLQAVIIAKLDRLTRRVKDLSSLLEPFEKRKVAPISVAESLDLGSAAGRLVITIMGTFSHWEREAIGERTRDTLRHRRWNGERTGNIEYGFRLAAYGRHNSHGHRTRRGTAWRLESVNRVDFVERNLLCCRFQPKLILKQPRRHLWVY